MNPLNVMLPLYDITRFTLLDYPDIPAAIFWFAGCNLRCTYCYNPDIVFGQGKLSEEEALAFLSSRLGLLEGVVLSGGECTLYPNLISFCRSIKALGFKIKMDTNAMRPDVIRALIREDLIDYAALDYKAPASKMTDICGGGSEKRFWECFDTLQYFNTAFEVRTTFHPDLLSEEEIITMSNKLKAVGYQKPFYVQLFREGVQTLGRIETSIRLADVERLAHFVTLRK
ncbi:anaerobic ribonucleoside-triphosphate reductase activating protein [Sulfuricurvum sp.]|uniref:anaerobic ribonucleoside-triphosphate reductase activating protein n=1 Tax=Sulfuricurvum sp. TaxID=2025608 RepID=UPI00286E724E|nr:anaerobic ribonucleoside-triphosphate reductase activating protein [Sulfuricurvum sp.]